MRLFFRPLCKHSWQIYRRIFRHPSALAGPQDCLTARVQILGAASLQNLFADDSDQHHISSSTALSDLRKQLLFVRSPTERHKVLVPGHEDRGLLCRWKRSNCVRFCLDLRPSSLSPQYSADLKDDISKYSPGCDAS